MLCVTRSRCDVEIFFDDETLIIAESLQRVIKSIYYDAIKIIVDYR